jgi:DNA-binding transcriptional regulator YdaS (Cro superfamily)
MPKLETYTAKCMIERVGIQSRAAKLLGISEPILRKRLKEADKKTPANQFAG